MLSRRATPVESGSPGWGERPWVSADGLPHHLPCLLSPQRAVCYHGSMKPTQTFT